MREQRRRDKGSGRVKRLIGYGLATLFAFGFGGFFMLTRMLREDAERLPTDIERAKGLGLPLSLDELEVQGAALSESENGADLFLKAMGEFRKLPPGLEDRLWVGRGASDADRMKAEHALRAFQPTMRILELAAACPAFKFKTSPIFFIPMRLGRNVETALNPLASK